MRLRPPADQGAPPVRSRVVLTVAGSDSGGGAGIQADLKTFAALGLHGASALTAVTVQNSVALPQVWPVPPEVVVAQIEAVAKDMRVSAVKTGMLGRLEVLEAVAGVLARLRFSALVVDPVLRSTTGAELIDAAGLLAYLDRLFPLATVVTPNLMEAAALLGRPVGSVAEMREAARELRGHGAIAVVVKGGHLRGEPVDVFADVEQVVELPGPRIPGAAAHGTGCVFSAALAARLALGDRPLEATRRAKAFTAEAIRAAYAVGAGAPVVAPPCAPPGR